MIGKTIGKYRIVEPLGRGAAGIVYRAVDEVLRRDVAIKTLNPDLADSEVLKRFSAEATILAKLNHPNIATIYDLFRSDSGLLMVMECVPGESLDKLADRLGPMSPERAAYLIDQVLSALEHAHRAGVVHRDVKPANVMVTTDGVVKIMDFGIARVRGVEQMTVDGRMMGTPAYMPPEQVLGEEVDGRADVYAVGVLFYRLMTGALPFAADTPMAMLQQHVAGAPVPLRAHREELPEWCEAIVQRALAKSPADRFQTVGEFREAVANAAGPLPADVAKAFAIAIGDASSAPAASRVTDTAVVMRPGNSDLVWASVVMGCAILTSLLAYFILRSEPAATPVAASVAAPPPVERPVKTEPPRPIAKEPARAPVEVRRPPKPRVDEAPLLFETRALVGSKGKQRERDAHLTLAEGTITVTADDATRRTLYVVPYESVISISYSEGRDPLWNSPRGPAPVTRAGSTFGRLIYVERQWISLRTSTTHQFVSMRFDDVLIPRVLLALEERTGRTPQIVVQKEEPK
jgi:serine/threonine-protein kinase